MTPEQIARRFVHDVWNGERPDTAYEVVGPQLPGLGGVGPDATLAWHADRRRSFPDLQYEIVTLVAEANAVAVRWRARGRHEGGFGPVPATGRPVDYEGATFLDVVDDVIVGLWSVNDLFGVLTQLGVRIEPPDPAAHVPT